ncbi:MAG: response regulator [Planctomycetota bacterium]|jgi:two-component system OmpR family response regulator
MSQKTILVADDDIRLLQALAVRLRSDGYRVVLAQNARQAVDKAQAERPDLLLLDINMPGGDGFGAHERIGGIDGLRDTPVVYLTGALPQSARDTARRLGAHAVLTKPFEADELTRTIREALGEAIAAPRTEA